MATVLSLRMPAGGFNALPERASGWDVAMPDPYELEKMVAVRNVPTKPSEYAKQLARIFQQNPELTVSALADRLDKPVKWVERKLQLTNLHPAFGRMLDRDQITLAQAEALSQWPAAEQGDHWNDVMALKEQPPMKFRLTFKTPDALDQLDEMDDDTIENVREFIAKYVKYGELVIIEFDTDKKTAKVVEA